MESNRYTMQAPLLQGDYALHLDGKTAEAVSHPSAMFHQHSSYELYYLCTGQRMMYFEGGTQYLLQKGDVLLIPPNLRHCTAWVEGQEHSRIILNFDRALIHTLIEQLEDFSLLSLFFPKECVISLPKAESQRITGLLDDIYRELVWRQEGFSWSIQQKIQLFLLSLVRNRRCRNQTCSRDNSRWEQSYIRPIVEFVAEHYRETISLQELSERFYVNTTMISRDFKLYMGVTMTEYVKLQRLQAAKTMLQNCPQMSVTSIGSQVGFNSATYFERVFKQQCGLTPKEYRRQFQTGNLT